LMACHNCCGASDSWKLLGIMFPPIVMKIK
jgi:hypothetical protein